MTELVVAFDKSSATEEDLSALDSIVRDVAFVKLGFEAHTAPFGDSTLAGAVEKRLGEDRRILKDLKINDIPNTVAAAVRNLAGRYGGITIHASSGSAALKAAVEARDARFNETGVRTALFGVTVLTSMDDDECIEVFGIESRKRVRRFATMLIDSGIDGIVCSGQELGMLRRLGLSENLTTLVPGTRPEWFEAGDQKRVITPAGARRSGADYVVVGRPVLAGPYAPADAVAKILEEMASATA